ncbi:MAG: DNA (cytosine-5-)-methyltransferase [Candidatus Poribacteria bacterium]|nr:DNA (cytosine-5-)-methyltransferase [Candidatus Poribacteria bacterium]
MKNCTVIDLFCGAGALTHGFILEGFNVAAGLDADKSCKYAYEKNNPGATFIEKRIEDVKAAELKQWYPEDHVKILVGCAPCQPFSAYNKSRQNKDAKWKLLTNFSDLISEIKPDIVSMENVPTLTTFRNGKVYRDFVNRLEKDYIVTECLRVSCLDYGIPQQRKRLVLFASKPKNSKVELLAPTHTPDKYKTVRDSISDLEPLEAGETSWNDPYHKAAGLSELNLRRIKASKQGGTWEDWPEELVAQCHRQLSGNSYLSIYGRMALDAPSPTITTQCYGFGNGRFGHPTQNRAISLREAARLQTFPDDYEFVHPDEPHPLSTISRFIGNAVPIELARVIARSIKPNLQNVR